MHGSERTKESLARLDKSLLPLAFSQELWEHPDYGRIAAPDIEIAVKLDILLAMTGEKFTISMSTDRTRSYKRRHPHFTVMLLHFLVPARVATPHAV